MRPEILSPVGSPESLNAALRAGADAVYFGMGDFNARKNADNFNSETLAKAVADCHRQNTKVYITLNTVISDQELPGAMSTVKLLCHVGIDGVILQDLGLAALIRKSAPTLKLHASTQMSIHSPSALPILKSLGFSRVVAAREMRFDELEEFCKYANSLEIEVEVFVHGALCMCVSGQCYLSAFLGGRSGNRGLCAQPCRLPFSIKNGTGYELSLKDLSIIENIDKLEEIGIASLKIEGRMKRPEYVAAATAACRTFVDTGTVPETLYHALKGVFSRNGFTKGYFEGNLGRDMFGIRTEDDVKLSAETVSSLHGLYRKERQCVGLKAKFSMREDAGIFTVSDGTFTVSASAPLQDSDNALSADFMKSKLSKLGGTNYFIEEFTADTIPNKYISSGALGEIRKSAIEQLDILRARPMPHTYADPEYVNPNPNISKDKQKIIVRFDDKSQIPARITGISSVVLPLERDFSNVHLPETVQKWIEIPRGIFGKEDFIKNRLKRAKEDGFTAALCGNLAAVSLAKDAGFTVVGDFGLNLYNSESIACAANFGVASAILSPELTLAQTGRISANIPIGGIVYGRLPLMLTRNCPVKNGLTCAECGRNSGLTDRKEIFFPVRCREGCSELYNSVPIWMADRKQELKKFDFCMLYFTTETRLACEEILASYLAEEKAAGEFTRGLFYRGVE